jgi:hypothetical protein
MRAMSMTVITRLTRRRVTQAVRECERRQVGCNKNAVLSPGRKLNTAASRSEYEEIEQALQDALEEVRHCIKNGLQRF